MLYQSVTVKGSEITPGHQSNETINGSDVRCFDTLMHMVQSARIFMVTSVRVLCACGLVGQVNVGKVTGYGALLISRAGVYV